MRKSLAAIAGVAWRAVLWSAVLCVGVLLAMVPFYFARSTLATGLRLYWLTAGSTDHGRYAASSRERDGTDRHVLLTSRLFRRIARPGELAPRLLTGSPPPWT